MLRYTVNRVLLAIPTLLGVAVLVFFLLRVVPGDIVEIKLRGDGGSVTQETIDMERKRLGLDRPLAVQFGTWMVGMATFDFGNSMWTERPVVTEIAGRLELSLQVAIMATLIAVLLAIPMGTAAALYGFALSAMASAHTSGLGYVMLREREGNAAVPTLTLKWRIGLPMALWFLALWIVYLPGLTAFQNLVARPMWVDGRLVIVKPRAGWDSLKPGSLVAHRLTGWSSGETVFREGLGHGPVLALAGERVEFRPDGVRVGARRTPLQPWMPLGTELTVPTDSVFVWPQFDVRATGLPGVAEGIYLNSAKVTRANFIGRPYQRWFFHRQAQP